MKLNRKYILAAVLTSMIGTATAQNLNSAYFTEDFTFRHDLNPAFGNENNYVSIPVLGNLGVKLQGNFGLDGVLFKNPNPGGKTTVTFMHPDITWDQVKGSLTDKNRLLFNADITILSGGFKGFGGYNTVEINERTMLGVNVPMSLFEFAKNTGNKTYDIGDLAMRAMSYAELAFGHSRQIDKDLRVGAKVKLLFGIGRANIEFKDFKADLSNTTDAQGRQQWTVSGDADATFNMKGLKFKEETKEYKNRPGEYTYINDADVDGAGISGFGLGLDLGATYNFDSWGYFEGLTVSAALTDLGFISWSNSVKASNHQKSFMFNGFHDISFKKERDPNTIERQKDDYMDQISDFANLQNDGDAGGETTMLAATARLGAEYVLPVYKPVSFGLLLQHRFDGDYSWTEGRVSANYRPLKWLDGGVNLGLNTFATSFGWVLNIHPRAFNFFIGMDHVMGKTTKEFVPLSSNASFNMGMNVTF